MSGLLRRAAAQRPPRTIPAAFVILILAVLTALLADGLQPRRFLADERPVNLEAAIPTNFGQWRLDANSRVPLTNPAANTLAATLYSQILERTYVSDAGEKVMLSVAYGRDQRDAMQVHRPEFCYAAQGYDVSSPSFIAIQTPVGAIAATRLITRHGPRSEPLTYWTTLGDHDVSGLTQVKRRLEVAYALQGLIADGLIFRVSTVDEMPERGFQVQSMFLQQLIKAADPASLPWLAGIQRDTRKQ